MFPVQLIDCACWGMFPVQLIDCACWGMFPVQLIDCASWGMFPVQLIDCASWGMFPVQLIDCASWGMFPVQLIDCACWGMFPVQLIDCACWGMFPVQLIDCASWGMFPVQLINCASWGMFLLFYCCIEILAFTVCWQRFAISSLIIISRQKFMISHFVFTKSIQSLLTYTTELTHYRLSYSSKFCSCWVVTNGGRESKCGWQLKLCCWLCELALTCSPVMQPGRPGVSHLAVGMSSMGWYYGSAVIYREDFHRVV